MVRTSKRPNLGCSDGLPNRQSLVQWSDMGPEKMPLDLLGLKCFGKSDPNDILPKGGDLMVMNSMVQAAKKSPTKHIQAIKGGK